MSARLPPIVPWTTMEKLVAILVGRGYTYAEIAGRLDVKKKTVKMHAENASGKLPGGDPPRMKLSFWWRKATEEQLAYTGRHGSER